jgi:hypothetical protein
MTQLLPPHPAPGEIVRVRQRQYLVEDVQPPPEPGEATLVSMSCLDDDAQGEALEVLWEHEIDTEVGGQRFATSEVANLTRPRPARCHEILGAGFATRQVAFWPSCFDRPRGRPSHAASRRSSVGLTTAPS